MTQNYDTWSEEEKRQAYFNLCAEVERLKRAMPPVVMTYFDGGKYGVYDAKELIARAEAAETTAARERERADELSEAGRETVKTMLYWRERAEDQTRIAAEERAQRQMAEARIEALEGCLRSFTEALQEWPANTNAAQLVRLAADAERLLGPSAEAKENL